ncbi:hypothetical protein ACNF5F_26950, partial [Escherichia coli]|uniref:hypothetical protein n=1 Tax=Escherichia coli TaxID=562 RepID=UPI003BA1D92F
MAWIYCTVCNRVLRLAPHPDHGPARIDCGSRQAMPGAGLQVSVRTASFAAARTFGSIRSTSAICV